ncbi:hypothetical protein F1559_001985 [Cyanidiococcus yangmingshanensis]|uniref:YbaK/aminoacyl-tRNA synthetase-associated domain-containing protein n=1 Tax=Cyanidiococcus yangmingshanensis TaxID=2690220 RepID=A0A7J7IFP6_9RHOD|nr:hypothetical protein F1559_001985 [Cyanidiococcus yangmingshanensis]
MQPNVEGIRAERDRVDATQTGSQPAKTLLEKSRVKLQELGRLNAATDALISGRVQKVLTDQAAVRLVVLAAAIGLRHCQFRRCPTAYYSWTLEQRRQYLEPAPTVYHLCKSLVLENIRVTDQDGSACSSVAPLYVCVVLPYPARLHADKVTQAVRSSPELCTCFPVSRSQIRYQVAAAETCEQLTGYGYNAVTPLGMRTPMPILVASALVTWLQRCGDDFFWLGGGATDLKLNVSLSEFIDTFSRINRLPVLIRDVTY